MTGSNSQLHAFDGRILLITMAGMRSTGCVLQLWPARATSSKVRLELIELRHYSLKLNTVLARGHQHVSAATHQLTHSRLTNGDDRAHRPSLIFILMG